LLQAVRTESSPAQRVPRIMPRSTRAARSGGARQQWAADFIDIRFTCF
jgi:hypothetical protein